MVLCVINDPVHGTELAPMTSASLPTRSRVLVLCEAGPFGAPCDSVRPRWRGAGWAPDFRSRRLQPVTLLVGSEGFGLRSFGERFCTPRVGCRLFRCDTALWSTSDLGTSPVGRQRGKTHHSCCLREWGCRSGPRAVPLLSQGPWKSLFQEFFPLGCINDRDAMML